MRRSSRLASKPVNEISKGQKRTRESSVSLSSEPETTGQKPAKKKQKLRPKTAVKTEHKDTKPLNVKEKIDTQGNTKKKTQKTTKRVKQEASVSGAKSEGEDVKPSHNKIPVKTAKKPENKKFIGAHVSISGGLSNAVYSAVEIGARAFAMFLRSQRQWNSKPLDDNTAQKFKEACRAEGFLPRYILPHGIYLMNCGSPDAETLEKSRNVLIEELQRCEKLGLTLYNFHPGSTCGKISIEDCITRIAESINNAHAKTKSVTAVIENTSCQGNTIGGKFEEIKSIIDQVKDKSRVGVCLDTCHTFAAGYDISTKKGYESVMQDFDKIIGFKYLKGIHLNDSKGELGCHLDRHENIGKGKIGREGFQRLMEDTRLDGIPMVLETPCVSDMTYTREIKTLYSMVA